LYVAAVRRRAVSRIIRDEIVTQRIGHTEIDFEKNGKQIGFLNLPSSVHDDAWGVLRIPLTVIKNGTGPTVILQGGNHGDEYEGPIVLGEIIRNMDSAQIAGRLIIVPAINLPAVEAGLRVSPIDDLNLNRSFPGDRFGSVTQQLSAYVNDTLFPLADAFIDLHSGGSSLSIVPSAIVESSQNDAELSRKNRAAVLAFGAPMNVMINNFGDPRTSTSSAVRAGLVTVGTEMGGAGKVSPDAVSICRKGVSNVLQHIGVLEIEYQSSASRDQNKLYEIAGPHSYVRATNVGVFEPYQALGDEVCVDQIAGRIHFLSDPAREPEQLKYAANGVVYGLRQIGRVRPGSCCVVVASAT